MKFFDRDKGITYTDANQANEAVINLRDQGYYKAKAEKYGQFYKVDKGEFGEKEERGKIDRRLAAELEDKEERLEAIREASGGRSVGQRTVKSFARGFGDIAKSLASSENRRRMRIAQMPGRKTPIAQVSNGPNPVSGRNAGLHRHNISNAPQRRTK